MKRSEINAAIREASACFAQHGWTLPPEPRWDVTDFGLDEFPQKGLVLVNLTEEPEYCEKLMYARKDQVTLAHTHRKKKEDIICRHGELSLRLWAGVPGDASMAAAFEVQVNGVQQAFRSGKVLVLSAGERVTLVPGIYHEFWPSQEATIIGEVSTANDDVHDNVFVDPGIGRFPGIEEDEPALVKLVSE